MPTSWITDMVLGKAESDCFDVRPRHPEVGGEDLMIYHLYGRGFTGGGEYGYIWNKYSDILKPAHVEKKDMAHGSCWAMM